MADTIQWTERDILQLKIYFSVVSDGQNYVRATLSLS